MDLTHVRSTSRQVTWCLVCLEFWQLRHTLQWKVWREKLNEWSFMSWPAWNIKNKIWSPLMNGIFHWFFSLYLPIETPLWSIISKWLLLRSEWGWEVFILAMFSLLDWDESHKHWVGASHLTASQTTRTRTPRPWWRFMWSGSHIARV